MDRAFKWSKINDYFVSSQPSSLLEENITFFIVWYNEDHKLFWKIELVWNSASDWESLCTPVKVDYILFVWYIFENYLTSDGVWGHP